MIAFKLIDSLVGPNLNIKESAEQKNGMSGLLNQKNSSDDQW